MSGTGIVRDDLFIAHDPGQWHPESPERLRVAYKMLDSGRWPGLVVLPRRSATRDEISLVHRPEHYDLIARTDGRAEGYLDPDTRTSPLSFQAALAAAGGMISLVEKVLDGELDNGFALVRPPGHHAEANRAMGFCLFNNVAVGAAWAIAERGLSRVMIVDWDLHHGNGTQHSFYDVARVLYCSTHQYPYYPGTGALEDVGRGEGRGHTVNVPLGAGHGDSDYVEIFRKLFLPLARNYRPELILVSAGFDIYRSDPLGGMNVTAEGFAAMTRLLKQMAEEVCHGRLAITLEGGYHIDGQAKSIGRVLDVLMGDDSAGRELAEAEASEPRIVSQVRKVQGPFWMI
ncbi:MAG: histone deacetylase [Proteobacteria bacterium]|nr:histone deacetylase [Pseudomonadota bacterium]